MLDKSRYRGIPECWQLGSAKNIDIFYSDDLDSLYEDMDILGIHFSFPMCLGFVKTKVWDYERETRLLCHIIHKKSDSSEVSNSDKVAILLRELQETKDLQTKFIYFDIPMSELVKFRIRFNPFMNEEMKEIIKGGIIRLCPGFPEDHFVDSALQSKIRI